MHIAIAKMVKIKKLTMLYSSSQDSSSSAANHFSTFSIISFLTKASSFAEAIWSSSCSSTQAGSTHPDKERKMQTFSLLRKQFHSFRGFSCGIYQILSLQRRIPLHYQVLELNESFDKSPLALLFSSKQALSFCLILTLPT